MGDGARCVRRSGGESCSENERERARAREREREEILCASQGLLRLARDDINRRHPGHAWCELLRLLGLDRLNTGKVFVAHTLVSVRAPENRVFPSLYQGGYLLSTIPSMQINVQLML